MPRLRSSCASANDASRGRVAEGHQVGGGSGGRGQIGAGAFERQEDPLHAGAEAHPGRGRSADGLDQIVVAAPASHAGLRSQHGRLELESGAGVVVHAAHQPVVLDEPDALHRQVRRTTAWCSPQRGAEGLGEPGGLLQHAPGSRGTLQSNVRSGFSRVRSRHSAQRASACPSRKARRAAT